LDENGHNQVQVCPELPSNSPRSVCGQPIAQLFLKFDRSVMAMITDCIHGNGYRHNLVSVIVMDAELATACAVFIPEDIKSKACDDLNGVYITDNFRLQALPFKPSQHSILASELVNTPGIFKLAVRAQFPKYTYYGTLCQIQA
jgi:hypothetical protein